MELNIIEEDLEALCPDIKVLFSNYTAEKTMRELVRESSVCLKDNM